MTQEGTIASFDEKRGWGVVHSDGGDYPFHCTQIADGTRTIKIGAAVTFEVVPGHLGRYEATAIREPA